MSDAPSQSVRFLPASSFGAAMGLGGLGLVCRTASQVLGFPAWLETLFVLFGALALVALLACYALKATRYPEAVRAELTNPGTMGFAATCPLAFCIVAGGLGPYATGIADVLWWIGYALLLATIIAMLLRALAGGIELAQVNTGWMLALVSGVVIPVAGVGLGHLDSCRFIFGVGLAFAPIVIGLVFHRMVVAPPLADALKPTWAIYVVPTAMIYINFPPLAGERAGLGIDAMLFITWIVAATIVIASRDCFKWPFGPAWWAFTFPADALAGAALRYSFAHPGPIANAAAWLATIAAIVVVVLVFGRTLAALARGNWLVAPPASHVRSA